MLSLRARERVEFFETLAHLLGAGMRVEQSLELIGQGDVDGPIGEVCQQAVESLRRGLPLSEALEKIAGIDAGVTAGILRAGEMAGNLVEAVEEVARWARHDLETRTALTTALMYPGLLVGAMTVAMTILVGYVIPQFSAIFDRADVTLGWGTRVVLGFGRTVQAQGSLFVGLGFAAALSLALILRSNAAFASRLLYGIPFVGQLASERDAGRICATLGTMLRGGVPLLESLGAAHAVAASPKHTARLLDAVAEARSGNRLAPVFKEILPGTAWGLVSAGEESGQLASMILEAGRLCDEEVKRKTQRAIAMIEPVLVLVISLMVGLVVGTLLLPLMELSTGDM